MTNILAIQHSDKELGIFALYGQNNTLSLYHADTGTRDLLMTLEKVKNPPIRIYYHHPYICVSERFGLHCAVVNRQTGAMREFSREDYHSDVSSYSIGFVEREGRVLLIHQTQWNRLDITDLETGACLTERDCDIRETGKVNYLDYFHSLLHVSPGGLNFLSNGWHWSPVDNIRCWTVDGFLRGYEPESFGIDFAHGYNWDRPCTFLDDDTFVVAVDDIHGDLDEDEVADYQYRQLQFYRMGDRKPEERFLQPWREIACDVFPVDKDYGEIFGELWYDAQLEQLIALSAGGAFGLDLDGMIRWQMPNVSYSPRHVFDYRGEKKPLPGWQYSPEHHRFYCWNPECGRVEIISTLENNGS